ncbi:cytochrome c biogenesis protein CcsA [Opitutus sp. GAS368]|uniref:cytochrome c biogenesis protein n=1 Tax=Opitutus sp. GAS368 TaxID=1882749 RepID=UPI00087A178B|nr:cytochrome c biogenesis protein CcsA [Opitutus sp. GAS368]SDS43987.1 ABC-type transport system involved in cytochrome c biogenesis, permease component [Opitutus sp. GAS368]
MKFLSTLGRDARDLLVSLKLTVVLILLSIILILVATLDQVNLGIWVVQAKYFNTFIVYWPVSNMSLAVFPGGYTLGGLLLANLLAAHAYRLTLGWRKLGLWLVHAGLVLLLVGQLLTGLWQDEYQMRLDQGETKNYSESYRNIELAVTDTTDAQFDDVVVIPESPLARKQMVQHPKLPFRVVVRTYLPNATLRETTGTAPAAADGAGATQGVGPSVLVAPQPLTFKQDERNLPAAYVELAGPDGSLGTWLVSPLLEPQRFDFAGRTWKIALRFARHYQPYTLTLLKFNHDRYAGTDIPKNFSSRLRLTTPDGREDREVLIYMNNPLRHAGLTFYQAGFANNDQTTVLQVVRNPSWLIPYVACGVMTLGLAWQFGLHLVAFIGRRRRPVAVTPATAAPRPAPAAPWTAARIFPLAVLALAVAAVGVSLFPPPVKSDFDLAGFGRLPTLVNGRTKPLDTVARTTLLVLQGRQRVTAPDGSPVSPGEWLLDMLYKPDLANAYPVFEIVHPDVLTLFNLTPEDGTGKKRFSFNQLANGIPELDRQAKLADAVESAVRSPFQRAVIQLRDGLVLYESLQENIIAPGVDSYLDQLVHFDTLVPAGLAAERAKAAGQSFDAAAAKAVGDLRTTFATVESFGNLRLIPPATGGQTNLAGWLNPGGALGASLARGRLDAATAAYVGLGLAWRNGQPAAFNAMVHDFRAGLEGTIPGFLRKGDAEARFNAAQPFYTSMTLYVVAFLLAVFSWLKWPEALGRAALWLIALAWVLATAGIAMRMWLEGRPPVTNLYSSALFIGWGSVALCLVLELTYRNAIGSVAAGLIGFATLLIAHHLSLSGDTLEMMRAVLDSNFWLATHVVTVTTGYAATFLAGFLALIYLARGIFTKSLDPKTADALAGMVYGVVCFATVFSFVGTVLGGIWADQSWGRFWGWDPKENGALIIVLWNSLILHARWGGLVKQRGLMALAVFGNVVTAWSWFGVNMLGVGLHSYGFMDAAFWWLALFMASQLAAIGLAGLPRERWRSPAPVR